MNNDKSILADIDNEASDSESVVSEMPSRAETPDIRIAPLDQSSDKPKRILRPISEEHKVKMQLGRAAAKLRRDQIYQLEKQDLEKKLSRLQLLELVDQETLQEAMNIIALKKNAILVSQTVVPPPEKPAELAIKPVTKKPVRKPRVSRSQKALLEVKTAQEEQGYNTDATDTSYTTSYSDSEVDDSLHGFRTGLTAPNQNLQQQPQFNPLSIYGKR